MARLSKEQSKLARQVGILTAIPFILVAGPVVGYFLGGLIDRRFGTGPVFLVIFLILGLIAGGRETYRLIVLSTREDRNGS